MDPAGPLLSGAWATGRGDRRAGSGSAPESPEHDRQQPATRGLPATGTAESGDSAGEKDEGAGGKGTRRCSRPPVRRVLTARIRITRTTAAGPGPRGPPTSAPGDT